MAFYLRPSTGHVSLQKLHTFAVNRLEFLLKIHHAGGDRLRLLDITNNIQTVADSDCLIEGTQKDNISHFILRLLFVADQETTDFFLQAETQLFQFRFSCLTEKEIYRLLKSTTKHVPTIKQPCATTYHETDICHVLSILQAIKQSAGTWQNAAHQYMAGRSGQYFHLPFQAVTPLVSNRRVALHRGMAKVHYDNLDEVLTGLFRSVLQLALKQVKDARSTALQDVRMKRCAKVLKSIYRTKVPIPLNWNNLSCLSHHQVDQLEHLFPLCMSSLHKALRTNHRLKHNDRVQYSLFLKEVGMPVHQAIKMWKQEYSQPSDLPGTGLHSWQADERRYTYNIRHLYGLEGARRNYRGHCCASLQRRQLGPAEQGGCPFVHFDNRHLVNLLTDVGIMEVDQAVIRNLKSSGDPCGACAGYLRHRVQSCLDQQGVDGRRDRHMQGHTPPVDQTLSRNNGYNIDCKHMTKASGHERVDRIQVSGQGGVVCGDGEMAGQDDVCEDSKTDGQDCDVILVSIHTKHRGVKRSLSNRSERVKRHVLWYESGKQAVQENRALMETNAECTTSSDAAAKIDIEEAESMSDSSVLCQNTVRKNPVEMFHDHGQTVSATSTSSRSTSEEHEQDFVHKRPPEHVYHSKADTHGTGDTFVHKRPPEHVCHRNTDTHGTGDSSKCGTRVSSTAASRPVPSSQSDTSLTHEDPGSCFEHDVCPSQTDSNTQLEKLDRVRGRLQHLSDFHIHKPVDFYTCFKELVEGLKSRVKEC
ncbi:DNA primase large subunit-like [Haliotis rubra]|uniref:DNA primase large subunit-like n=1 Tax=Haliotis rubra TaxID=36100 RepID=UPI001EE557D0|nr:DNA primase large subunit-like [Haliotis rubra]